METKVLFSEKKWLSWVRPIPLVPWDHGFGKKILIGSAKKFSMHEDTKAIP